MMCLWRLCCLLIVSQDGNGCHEIHQELGCWLWPGRWCLLKVHSLLPMAVLPRQFLGLGRRWPWQCPHICPVPPGSLVPALVASPIHPHQNCSPPADYHTSSVVCKRRCVHNANEAYGCSIWAEETGATTAMITWPLDADTRCPLAHALNNILVHLLCVRPCSR